MEPRTLVFIVSGLLLALLLAGCTQNSSAAPPASNAPPGNNAPPANSAPPVSNAAVSITANGYEPQTVSILKGGTVTWTNSTDSPNWPATAKHPTHTVYPGSGIEKCGSLEESTIFDACRGLAKGESYSFTFNNAGEWAYHDHVNAKMFGKVIVAG